MPYALFATVVLASLVALALVGLQAWVVAAVAIPFAIAYLLFDRRMKARQEREGT